MELANIQKAYARWAPHYDFSFGIISDKGRTITARLINRCQGKLLEVGVGTGLSLPYYGSHLSVTGVDVSQDMLKRARERADKARLRNIAALQEMDATNMQYEDGSFDVATAMYIMSVVPNPKKVMEEMARVVKTGGDIFIVNHFAAEKGVMGVVEKVASPICKFIGWHSDFPKETIMGNSSLKLIEQRSIPPLGLFQILHFKKT
jgi:phosphatidylethanolamine/phosphatidyl-N-methylethanolamine N-methyltransferase